MGEQSQSVSADDGQPRKRGPYARTAITRQRAIDAAIEIFSVSGYRGTTLTDVAERMGMTLTGLQHHFADKDALLAAVLHERDHRSRVDEKPTVHGEATERLLSIVDRNQDNPGLTELHAVLSAEATDPDHPAHEYFVERYAREREAGRRYFQRLIDEGLLSGKADPHALATMLIALADGLQLQWLLDRDVVDMRARLRDFLVSAVPAIASASE